MEKLRRTRADVVFEQIQGVADRRKNFCFTRASLYALSIVPIRFSKKSRRYIVRQASGDGAGDKRSTRVRLRPSPDWHKRNFLTSVLFPSLFIMRSGDDTRPLFPLILQCAICF